MPYTVSLHKEPKMTHNYKYRTTFSAPAIWTGTVVNNGNFSNKNLFVDNSVELCVGNEPLQWGNEKLSCECNYIKIVWDKWTVIGLITDWQYINDGNMNISYSVDSFMSARVSGVIDEMKGLCERANVVPATRFTNLQPEPFAPSDIMEANPTVTANLNDAVEAFEGVSASPFGVDTGYADYVLTVSPTVMQYIGNPAPMTINPNVPTPTLITVTDMNFKASDTTVNCGGIFKGTPIRFKAMSDVKAFIKKLLSGCGFRTEMGGNGWKTQQANTRLQYLNNANLGGGETYWQYKNTAGDPMESIHFITIDDFYSLYAIPDNFCKNQGSFIQSGTTSIEGFKSTGDLHIFGGENAEKGKLTCYPYYYSKCFTANGDTFDIIPQTHHVTDQPTDPPKVKLEMRYIGGDSPRLMGRIMPRHAPYGAYSVFTTVEWFTIRSYPAISFSIDSAFNIQMQKDVQNIRKLTAVHANALTDYRLSNPIKSQYWDTVNGTGQTGNNNRGAGGTILSWIGGGMGGIEGGNHDAWGNAFKDDVGAKVQNEIRSTSAGNFTTTENGSLMGNDFGTQYGLPAFGCFDCGATDAEMFGFSRYIEEFGQALNCIINPLTNAGSIWNGNGTITPVDGKTFYQFSSIHIKGDFPVEWKAQIKALFESGVYLMD